MPKNPNPLAIANITDAETWINGKGYVGPNHNHTSQQITDLTEAVQDIVAGFITGTNLTITYNDAGNALNLTAVAGTTFDPEATRDAIGAALIGVGNIAVSINDAADTITISTTATANSTDAYLLSRANHTGTQAAGTITGLSTVATSGSYADLSAKPTIPTTAYIDAGDTAAKARANHTGTQPASTITGLGTSAALDVPATPATASSATQVVRGDDPRFGAGATTASAGNGVFASTTTAVTFAAVGTEYALLSITITPKLATSVLAFTCRAGLLTGNGTTVRTVTLRLRKGSASTGALVGIAVPVRSPGSAATHFIGVLLGQDSPAATTAQTYTLWGAADSITSSASSSTQIEISAIEILGVQASSGGTGTIADGSITKAKLETAVQTSLGKADIALPNNAVVPLTVLPDTVLPYLNVTTNGNVQTLSWDAVGLFDNIIWPRFQAMTGWANNDTVVLAGNKTFTAKGSSTTTPTTPTNPGGATTFTTFATDNATYSSGTFTITNPATKSSAIGKKLPGTSTTGKMQGVSGNIWIGFSADATYQPNSVSDGPMKFAMRYEAITGTTGKIIVYCSNGGANKYQTDGVTTYPPNTILRPGVDANPYWAPEYSTDNGVTWSRMGIIDCPRTAGEDTWAVVVTTPDDNNRTNVTGLAYLNLV
jgi:hypothetical protein